MWDFWINLFDTSDFPARWECGTWTAGHGWLHVLSDFAIFGAYAAIPLVLVVVLFRRDDLPFPPIFWLFVAFISACGLGHLIETTIFWHPWYRLSGVVKFLTAVISWVTVIGLVRVLPQALRLPGLASINENLRREIGDRERAEAALTERAAELEQINEDLESVSRLVVGREKRIIELKREVNSLLDRIGEVPRYALKFDAQLPEARG